MNIQFLHHVNVVVQDLDEASRFYTEVLGLQVRSDRPDTLGRGVWLDLGAHCRVSLVEGDPIKLPEVYHFALVIEDIDKALAELESNRWPIHVRRDPLLQIMLQDPSGNWIELRQPPAAYAALGG